MQLIRVPHERLRLLHDLRNGRRIEPSQIADRLERDSSGRGNGPRPPFLDLSAIQEGVQIRVEQLEGKRRRLPRVAGDEGDLTSLDPAQDVPEAVDVERFVQAVFHRLAG